MSIRIRTALLASLLIGRALSAQATPRAQLEVFITDSVHARPLVGAWIFLTHRDTEPLSLVRVITDDKGRYRFDNLSPGTYSVGFGSEMLDSLDVVLPERTIVLAPGQRARMDLWTPSGMTLRAAACPGLAIAKGFGAVVGYVTDADNERPIPNASVVVSWTELTVDRSTLQAAYHDRNGAVRTDSLGLYRLCGVPTDSWILVQIQRDGRAGVPVRITVPDDIGVVLQQLSISRSGSRAIAAIDSTRPDTMPPAPLRGTAELSGVVRTAAGQPLSAAQVRVLESESVAITDSSGRYALRDLPAGTQILEARRIGYLLTQIPVQLRSSAPTRQDIQLLRIVNLDSIRVVAQRAKYRDFERNKKQFGGFGKFFDQEAIERRNPMELSDFVRTMPGFRVNGSGLSATVVSARGSMSIMNATCPTNIVIDGMPRQDINLVRPNDVGAIEFYAGQTAPALYQSACGTIMIWTKR